MTEAAPMTKAAPARPLRRVALGLSYDGTGFHGFAAQRGQRTVAGALVEALSRLSGSEVLITCAGRTDTGVHARCQVVHVDLPGDALSRYGPGPELPGLVRSLSRQLGPEIAVWRALLVPGRFDARRSATFRAYRYDLELTSRLDPAFAHASWHLGVPLDLAAMRLGSDPLIGEHDFGAFSRRPKDAPQGPLRRRVLDARWTVLDEGHLRFEIEAQSFAQQMVRSIVGMLVEIGKGRARPSDVVAMLRAGDRQGAPRPAPPGGLCLVAVGYPEDLGGPWS